MLVALTQQQDGLIPQLLTKMNVDPVPLKLPQRKKFPSCRM